MNYENGDSTGHNEDDHQRSFAFSFQRPFRKNIINRLFDQQYQFSPKYHPFVITNRLHQNLIPNFSVENAERPNCFPRKFTYDGRYLMAFSADINSVELYEYQGPGAAAELLKDIPSNQDYLSHRGGEHLEIRRNIFNTFFKLKHSIRVTIDSDQLHRECSLFTDDNRFLIVASTSLSSDNASFYERYQNNESIQTSSTIQLENYCFHLIDMNEGKVLDRIRFKTDKIYIGNNQGIYMYGNLFAILSVQHQTIYLYYIMPTGSFVQTRTIGRFCFEDDLYVCNFHPETRWPPRPRQTTPFGERTFNSLKQRLLAFAFKQAKQQTEQTGSPKYLGKFYQDFDLYLNLRMYKMQLLDEEYLLIKYEQKSILFDKPLINGKKWNLFAIYNWKTAQFLNIYPQYSNELLKAFENFCDYFRHPPGYPCSLSNNYYARKVYNDFKRSIFELKNGNTEETIRSILALLPNPAQSITPSPFLDQSLFSYDEKFICSNEKPMIISESPIRFYDRQTGRLLFRLHTGQIFIQRSPRQQIYTRLVAFIFHPTDPFIISVQRYNSQYLLHFHIRHCNGSMDENSTC